MTSAVRRSARISTNAAVLSSSKTTTTTTATSQGASTLKEGAKGVKGKNGTTSNVEPVDKKRKSRPTSTSTATSSKNIATSTTIPLPAPQTPLPKSKRRKPLSTDSPIKPPPFTPTPAAISLLAKTSTRKDESQHPLEDLATLKPRPAEPRATNAPLSTPGGSRVVAYSSSPVKPLPSPSQHEGEGENVSPSKKRKAKEVVPPDVGSLPHPTSTIDTLLLDACEHLCTVDPKLRDLIEKHHCNMFSPEGLREVVDPFTALASGIIGQQVSGQAAASIRKKFTGLFPTDPDFPTPAQVIEKDIPTLRTAGLSQRKAEYIQGLAEKFSSGELSAQMLVSASDEDLIDKLVAVRGLGRWSVEMFACFGLKRMDVFSTGDLGVQRGMATYIGKDVSKLKNKGGKWKYMTEKEMLDVSARFSPYRSLFMWYMWRISDVDISVLQE